MPVTRASARETAGRQSNTARARAAQGGAGANPAQDGGERDGRARNRTRANRGNLCRSISAPNLEEGKI